MPRYYCVGTYHVDTISAKNEHEAYSKFIKKYHDRPERVEQR